ncbi:MAG: protease inhibitor I42 family protein [Planctomycetota bacterium]
MNASPRTVCLGMMAAFLLLARTSPGGEKVVKTFDDKGSSVQLSKGDLLVVELPAQLSTGYNWYPVDDFDADVLAIKGKEKSESAERIGGKEKVTITAEAINEGKTTLRFVYVRPTHVETEDGPPHVKAEVFEKLKKEKTLKDKDLFWIKVAVTNKG